MDDTHEPAVYSKEFYTACPAIEYLDDAYYMFHLAARGADLGDGAGPQPRPRSLGKKGPPNPVLAFSEEDKQIANSRLTDSERDEIAKALNRNDSDFDRCEYHGKVIINCSWGDQHGTEFLAEAYYGGTLDAFLKGSFPE